MTNNDNSTADFRRYYVSVGLLISPDERSIGSRLRSWLAKDRSPVLAAIGVLAAVVFIFIAVVMIGEFRADAKDHRMLRTKVAALDLTGTHQLGPIRSGCFGYTTWSARRRVQFTGSRSAAMAQITSAALQQGWVDGDEPGSFSQPGGYSLDIVVSGPQQRPVAEIWAFGNDDCF